MSRALSVGFQDRLYQRHPDYAVVEAKVAAATASEGRMTTAALEEILQAIKVDTELLEHENAMFQSYITCVAGSEPQQLRVTPDALSNSATDDDASEASEGSVAPSIGVSVSSAVSSTKRKGTRRRASLAAREVFLEAERKLEVVSVELDRLRMEREGAAKSTERTLEGLRAATEEAEARALERRRGIMEFSRDFPADRKLDADRLLRYLQDEVKDRDDQLAKLRQKGKALRAQITKCEHQLRQREDLGEVLSAVDFDQLQIENRQFVERLEQKNRELMKLKQSTGRTVQALNAITEQLSKCAAEQTWLQRETEQRAEALRKLSADVEQVERERGRALRRHDAVRQQHDAVKVPKVEDYIQLTAEVGGLRRAVTNWKRKVEIATGCSRKITPSPPPAAATVGRLPPLLKGAAVG
jgi:myosin heavy subunit